MLKSILPLALALAAVGIPSRAYSQELKQEYVGKSGCRTELRRGPGTYGTRLDSRKRAYLKAYTVDDRNLLLIVQYSDNKDQCGIVRDFVQTENTSTSFVFDCMDPGTPHDIVVGTWPSRYQGITGPAVEAWRVNLRELKFLSIPAGVRVRCTSGPGPDDHVTDLAESAKKRTTKF